MVAWYYRVVKTQEGVSIKSKALKLICLILVCLISVDGFQNGQFIPTDDDEVIVLPEWVILRNKVLLIPH